VHSTVFVQIQGRSSEDDEPDERDERDVPEFRFELEEITNGITSQIESLNYFWKCAQMIEASAQTGNKSVKWFVTTDSDYVRNYTISTFANKTFEVHGEIVHVDKMRGEDNFRQGMLKTLVDMMTLSESDNYYYYYE
jgi:hypothetical protein